MEIAERATGCGRAAASRDGLSHFFEVVQQSLEGPHCSLPSTCGGQEWRRTGASWRLRMGSACHGALLPIRHPEYDNVCSCAVDDFISASF